jgi:hypothetical protein
MPPCNPLGGGFLDAFGVPAVRPSPFEAMAQRKFEKRPLADALRELAEGTAVRVVLDAGRAGDKARTPVTADLENVSLEDSVRVLADLADLAPVFLGNVAYVTTRDNAKLLQENQPKRSLGNPGPRPPGEPSPRNP